MTVRYYTGRIDEWIVWNEPEFHPNDAAGQGSYTWLGTDAEFARLMEVAYLAAKRANPNATVAFPGTSYWVDHNSGRLQFYERFLRLEASNPDAPANDFFHDAVPLNLYRAPDDLVRLHQEFKDVQKKYRVDKPLWLLELNAMPTDDRSIPCGDQHVRDPIQTTQVQQAAYAIQALALAAVVGYERIGFYQMIDDNPCNQSGVAAACRGFAADRRAELLWFPAGAFRSTRQNTRALGGLAERSQVIDSQLAGVPGGLRSAGQPPGDGPVERRWSAAAGPHSTPGLAGQSVGHERRRTARTHARRSGLGHYVASGNGALLG